MMRNCKDCRFYHEHSPKSECGDCRRNPPVVVLGPGGEDGGQHYDTCWPQVARAGWCGQWENIQVPGTEWEEGKHFIKRKGRNET